MNDNPLKDRPLDMRNDLLDLIAQMPEDEQASYREVVDEMKEAGGDSESTRFIVDPEQQHSNADVT